MGRKEDWLNDEILVPKSTLTGIAWLGPVCPTCGGSAEEPRPLPYYTETICNSPYHPLDDFLKASQLAQDPARTPPAPST